MYYLSSVSLIIFSMLNDKKAKEFLIRFGKRIRKIREDKGLTLEETEEYGYLSWRHLQRIETGKNVNLLTVYKISKLYNIKLSELLKNL